MQKVLRHAKLIRRQAARREAAQTNKTNSDKRKLMQRDLQEQNTLASRSIKAERKARREDWELGPLAPKRDVGEDSFAYGALEPRRVQPIEKVEWKEWGIVTGDRVVIAKEGHRDRGKIGKVIEVNEKAEQVVVERLNMADIKVPDYMLLKDPDKSRHRPYTLPIPLEHVRLVAPLPHPDTGVEQDVVIKELELRKVNTAQQRGREPPARFIAGVEPPIQIPYPEKQPEQHDEHDGDTTAMEVEERTWLPTLSEPPMPPELIDELRNKYGKFRTRHEEWWIEEKERKEREEKERVERKKLQMMTPMEELRLKKSLEREARGPPKLSEDMLARIGQVMERNMRQSSTGDATRR